MLSYVAMVLVSLALLLSMGGASSLSLRNEHANTLDVGGGCVTNMNRCQWKKVAFWEKIRREKCCAGFVCKKVAKDYDGWFITRGGDGAWGGKNADNEYKCVPETTVFDVKGKDDDGKDIRTKPGRPLVPGDYVSCVDDYCFEFDTRAQENGVYLVTCQGAWPGTPKNVNGIYP